jgi:hypothetical protein
MLGKQLKKKFIATQQRMHTENETTPVQVGEKQPVKLASELSKGEPEGNIFDTDTLMLSEQQPSKPMSPPQRETPKPAQSVRSAKTIKLQPTKKRP